MPRKILINYDLLALILLASETKMLPSINTVGSTDTYLYFLRLHLSYFPLVIPAVFVSFKLQYFGAYEALTPITARNRWIFAMGGFIRITKIGQYM